MKMKFLSLFSVLLFSVLFFTACSSGDDVIPETPEKPIVEEPETPTPETPDGMVTVKFNVDMDMEVSNLTRAINDVNGLYGLNVYQRNDSGEDATDVDKKGKPYAYGYFDNLNSLILQLVKVRKYNFEMVYIPNGKNVIHRYEDGTYGNPFRSMYSEEAYTGKINEFIYTSTSKIDMMYAGISQGKGITSSMVQDNQFNEIERYQGLLWNFDPATNETINIKLYRMMFGLKLNIKDFTEGTITMRTNYGIKYSINANASGSATLEKVLEMVYMPTINTSYYNNSIDFNGGQGFEDDNVSDTQLIITYNKDGNELTLYNNDIQFLRMKMYTFTFSVSDAIKNGTIVPDVDENEKMEEIDGKW